LHEAIFDAFDREEEHLYEFQLGGSGPMDPKARRYGLTQPADFGPDESPADVSKTAVGSLGLKVGDTFGYWFDFGDDWWHHIKVDHHPSATSGSKAPRTQILCEDGPFHSDSDQRARGIRHDIQRVKRLAERIHSEELQDLSRRGRAENQNQFRPPRPQCRQ
jgi:hypothetical protein